MFLIINYLYTGIPSLTRFPLALTSNEHDLNTETETSSEQALL